MAYLYEIPYLDLEIYRLLAVLESSPALAEFKGQDETDRNKVEFLRKMEFPEVSRIVVSLAAIIRSAMVDADPKAYAGELEVERPVGVLMPDDTHPHVWEGLYFREACNKVIYAKHVDPQQTGTGALTGELFLYGKRWNKNWQARLDVREYALAALSLTP